MLHGYRELVDIEDVMNFLIEHSARNLPAAALADILDRLTWSLSEKDTAELEATARRWLSDGDARQTEIALSREDSFPARTRADLVALMDRASTRHPEFQSLAAAMVERWDRQFTTLT